MKNNVKELMIIIICIPLLIGMIFGIIKMDVVKASVETETTTTVETPLVTTEKINETTESVVIENENSISLEEKYKSVFDWQIYSGDFGKEQLYYLNDQCVK